MLAAAVTADISNRGAVRVGRDDRVHAVGFARAAEVLDGIPGAIRPRRHALIVLVRDIIRAMRYVAFLRAVNVGKRTMRMDSLKASCEAIDLANVATFIASGNVVFDSRRAAAALESRIETKLEADFGFVVDTMIRSIDQLREVQAHVSSRRFLAGPGVSLYVGFLKREPAQPGRAAVAALSNDVDRISVHGRELYWQARKGFAESTLTAARLEKLLGTSATLRNMNTVERLLSKFGNG